MFWVEGVGGVAEGVFVRFGDFWGVEGAPVIIKTLLRIFPIKVKARKQIHLPKQPRHNPQLNYLPTRLLILMKSILQKFDKLHPSPVNFMRMLLHKTLIIIISQHTPTILHTARHQVAAFYVGVADDD